MFENISTLKIDAINTDSYEDAKMESGDLLPENYSSRYRRQTPSGQPILIKQIYQLAEFFKKIQHRNKELKRIIDNLSDQIPVVNRKIDGIREKFIITDEKIIENQRQLNENIDSFNEHSTLIMDRVRNRKTQFGLQIK